MATVILDTVPRFVNLKCSHCAGAGVTSEPNPVYLAITRKRAKVSLRELAGWCGMSAPYMSDLEWGRRRLNRELFNNLLRGIKELSPAPATKGDADA